MLGDGSRRPKHNIRIEAYGNVDEANAAIGMARLHASGDINEILARVQNDLFDLGADLCVPQNETKKTGELRISKTQTLFLEATIDNYNASLPPLKSFVLPAGTALATNLHLARTITRRAERSTAALAASETINSQALIYLNRLSDLLFVLSRYANDNNEILWQAGANL